MRARSVLVPVLVLAPCLACASIIRSQPIASARTPAGLAVTVDVLGLGPGLIHGVKASMSGEERVLSRLEAFVFEDKNANGRFDAGEPVSARVFGRPGQPSSFLEVSSLRLPPHAETKSLVLGWSLDAAGATLEGCWPIPRR